MSPAELREHYFFELKRKADLESALGLPVAVLSGLVGVVAFYADRWSLGLPATLLDWTFTVLAVAGGFSLLVGFAYIARSLARYNYEVVGDAQEYLSYRDELKWYYASSGSRGDWQAEYEAALCQRYAQAIDLNSTLNIRKAAFIYRARLSLAGAGIALALAAVPHFLANGR